MVGAGAVGSFYGAMLARAGHTVTLIGREAHMQAINLHGIRLDLVNSDHIEHIRLRTSTDIAQVRDADLILFCAKSIDSESTALSIAPYLQPHAVIISLQNGIEKIKRISQNVINAVIPAVVYVATELTAPGYIKHHGGGDLVIGTTATSRLSEPQHILTSIATLFASAQVEARISDNVLTALWSKLLINCTFNAISGLSQLSYGEMVQCEAIQSTQAIVIKEVIAVAKTEGVDLSEADALQTVSHIANAMPSQKSSTAHDMARKKLSEIDHLNGFIVRRGTEQGVPTPTNQALYAMVKLIESSYAIKTT